MLTCEHASNLLPAEFKFLEKQDVEVWNTHRAFDLGAYSLFLALIDIADINFSYLFSRLLIEPNRSLQHRSLFSEYSKKLSKTQKAYLIQNYYVTYRSQIEACISKFVEVGEAVLHISIHSFTPILHGVKRNTDIGVLYNPDRKLEKLFAKILKQQCSQLNAEIKFRFNYPYLGVADGFTTYLRKKFPENYMGIELEVNQKFVQNNAFSPSIIKILKQGLLQTLNELKNAQIWAF